KKISNHLFAGHAAVGVAFSERERFTGLAADGIGLRVKANGPRLRSPFSPHPADEVLEPARNPGFCPPDRAFAPFCGLTTATHGVCPANNLRDRPEYCLPERGGPAA
ncbi:MAG: hypothetical protein OXF56_12865, partial [Rhodobacteraceae bacterium]|nr:hypothetical protein [Paracoccaceae bacterium]